MALATLINGRPTRAQADKVFERVKSMADGDTISHGDVEAVMGEKKGTFRYATVLTAARKRIQRELGVHLAAERGVGYRRCTGIEQIRHGVGSIGRGVRNIHKGVTMTAAVTDDRLPDGTHRKQRDFIVQQAQTLAEVARHQKKTMSLTLGKPELLPK